jgi:uroporphyrinogen III methyltransferase/synthase
MAPEGFVSLIGGGPGDPGLLTLDGAQALSEADVVIYDYLANPALLAHCRPGVQRIYVGKKAGEHTLSQAGINARLVEEARAGRRVARLKGGDPFVFGRGGEEAQALAEAGVPFAVIPGVTSAVAVPAYAGIPVTQRGAASSFAVITGREDSEKSSSLLDWSRLAMGADTLVFLMGAGNLPQIVEQLLAHGRAPETPAAVVRWGTTPAQQTVVGNLANISERVQAAGLKPPVVTVVGQVVTLREQLRWFENLPLFGHRILVTRAREQAGALSRQLRVLGAEAIELPTVQIAPPEDWGPLDRAIYELSNYHWAVFTSANGVQFFWDRLAKAGLDTRALHSTKVAAIGPATATELQARGLKPDFLPTEYVAEAVAAGLEVRGQRILLPRADIARPALAELLRNGGAEVVEVTAYRTLRPHVQAAEFVGLLRDITMATFTSSSTVANLAAMARDAGLDLPCALQRAIVACIGPITAQTACDLGLAVDVVADEYTISGLVQAVVQHAARAV